MSYPDKLNERAEQMAEMHSPAIKKIDGEPKTEYELYAKQKYQMSVKAMLPLAAHELQCEAEAVRKAYYNALGITPTCKDIEHIIEQYLISNGYVPEGYAFKCDVCGENLSGRMEVLTGKCEDC